MEKDSLRSNTNSIRRTGDQEGGYNITDSARQTAANFVLQWGNRKRLRCMKVQVKEEPNGSLHRVDRRVARADKDGCNCASGSSNINNGIISHNNGSHLNLRHRPSPPPPQRLLRNSEHSTAMRGQSNGAALRRITSPDRGARDKRSHHHHHHLNSNGHDNSNSHHNGNTNSNGNRSAQSSETAHDGKKGGTSSASGDAASVPVVWPPKFVIALTNKEKEEDFYAFKGSKLPQRPKKRAKFIQRTLNLVSPGAWLCDLTLERYEVREKKISKKRARGLKAMGNMESDSE